MRTRIKICGVTNLEDALAACELGADAVGFVFAESPRQVCVEWAAKIIRELPPFVRKVGIFTEEHPRVAAIAGSVPLDLIQLHGDQTDEFAKSLGSTRVIRVVRVRDRNSLRLLEKFRIGTAYLLDAWSPSRKGGTGATFNWDLAVEAKNFGKPVILAGGLTPGNAADAIRYVRPYAVDVSSGVELHPGKKDYDRMKEFIENVRAADENA